MDDRPVEAALRRELGVAVQCALVPAEPIEECLLRQGGRFDDSVWFSLWWLVASAGPLGSPEAALTAQEERGPCGVEGLAGIVTHPVFSDQQGGLALVKDVRDMRVAGELRLRR